jgi:CheY-like chemotaxis protein
VLSVAAQTQSGTEGVPQPEGSPSPRTILVVENNQDDAALLKIMFRRAGIGNPIQIVESIANAKTYLTGEGAFADRQTHPFPALIIIDSHLGDGSGFDLLRWLQAHKAQTPRAVVMLTGSDIHSFKTSYELGAHSFLTKPLKFPDFQNMVQRIRGITLTRIGERYLLELD